MYSYTTVYNMHVLSDIIFFLKLYFLKILKITNLQFFTVFCIHVLYIFFYFYCYLLCIHMYAIYNKNLYVHIFTLHVCIPQ
jgi:hypothetical protein